MPSPGCLSAGMNSGSDGPALCPAGCSPERAPREQSGAAEPMRRHQSLGLRERRQLHREYSRNLCRGS